MNPDQTFELKLTAEEIQEFRLFLKERRELREAWKHKMAIQKEIWEAQRKIRTEVRERQGRPW